MLRPVELEMEGFRSFRENIVIPFPKSGLMLITGHWRDAPTGSGAGKSSVPLAMAFALGYCDRPATSLKNWHSKKMLVRFRLTDDIDVIDVIRDPKLSLVINGGTPIKEGAEEKLAAILKTSPDLAQALTYRRQRKPDETFIKKTDSDKKEFLSTLLGLSKMEKGAEEFAASAKAAQLWIDGAKVNLKSMADFVTSNQVTQESMDKARSDYETAAKRYDEVVAGAQNPELTQKLAEAQGQWTQIQTVKQAADRAQRDIQALRQEFMALGAEVKKLKENQCFTCNREWAETGDILAQKEARAREIVNMVNQKQVVIANSRDMLDAEPRITAMIQELNQQIGQLKAPVQDAYSARAMAEASLRRLQESKNQIDKAKQNCMTLWQQIQDSEKAAKLNNLAALMTGRTGYLSEIFDEVLAEIEGKANDMIIHLPNVATFNLQISSVSATQKGVLKKTIATKIIKDNEERDIKDISGGQQCSIELSTDLAVANTIRRRSGSQLGWIALDEAMDGLDVEPKKAAIEAIRAQTKGLVIIIDHATEIKESFDAVVDIEFDGRDSYASPQA